MTNLTNEELDTLVDLLVDAEGVAQVLGLASGNAVRAYLGRFNDFPAPIYPRPPVRGKNLLWYLPRVLAWREQHPPRARPDKPADET